MNLSAVTINPAGSPKVVQQIHGATAPIAPKQQPSSKQTGGASPDQSSVGTGQSSDSDE